MSNLPMLAKQAEQLATQTANVAENLKTIAVQQSQNAGANGAIDPLFFAITIFVLACFVGYYVVWKVTPALHTPLMSVTNAISGIIILGSMIALAPGDFSIASILGFIATFIAAINIFGGFVVTERMLEMFRKK